MHHIHFGDNLPILQSLPPESVPVQGAAYGMSPYLRISYATDTDSLREACTRIQEFCRDLA